MRKVRSIVAISTLVASGAAFSTISSLSSTSRASQLSAHHTTDNNEESRICRNGLPTAFLVSLAILTSPLHNTPLSNTANADELGKETEAPTLFTGETVMICKKRGPLGACLETTIRTADNDNDKALKYFKDPSAKVKEKQERMMKSASDDSEGNELIEKLRKQSLDNKEKNELAVLQKTLINDQSASFGPFDRQVVILNTDGKTFTLLQNPQAMRLKKAGYIEDRKFVIQPTQEVIDEALKGEENLGDAIKGFFGGGGDGGDAVEVQVEVKGDAIGAEENVVAGDEN